ncbi:MAG: alpha/beta hydrolase [Chloroflexota bacterium]|nr:MAG: alpha/beta hydrolase [Chloroflexota bacterium]
MPFPYLTETQTLTDEKRAGLPCDFIRISDGVTHYELSGPEDAPLVVLVHGFSVPYYVWDPTFAALTEAGFRVLRYDLFGRGFSDRPRLTYDIDLFDRQLAELASALGITSPVNLIGLSMGGPITLTYTARRPELVNSLALIDPAGFTLSQPWYFKLITLPILGELFFGLFVGENLFEKLMEDFFDPKNIAEFLDRYRVQMSYRGFRRALLSTMRSGMLGDFSETYRRVGELDTPVLLLWGREDKTVPFAHSQYVIDAIPQTKFYPIENAGHIPHYERPGVVNSLLLEFLR